MKTLHLSGTERLGLGLVAAVALYAAYVGLGMSTNAAVCRGWAAPASPIEPMRLVTEADMAVFGTVDSPSGGCTAEVWHLMVALAVLVAVIGLIVWLIVTAVAKWRQSDAYFIKDVRHRPGVAQSAEVKGLYKWAKQRIKNVRPTKKRAKLDDAALHLGRSAGHQVWVTLEESLLLIGPPRSGKGLHLLIDAILDAPGPVITTSSRADNYAATSEMRAAKGPVALFDPQGLTGMPTTLKWSPITGCERASVASQRAASLIGASGLGSSGNNAEWKAPAMTIMECLLHAAALGDRSVDDLMRWGSNPADAAEAVGILNSHPQAAGGWDMALRGIINGDPKMLQNKWFGVEGCVKGLSVPEVREVLRPRTVEETFDIDRFIHECGTLYIVGTKTGGSSAGPFLIAMMDAITERARELAARMPGNRLDPPMSLVLDEIANISGAWPGLTQLMADGGGVGISPFAVFQSMAQARNEWGEQEAQALFDAATVKLQLGGASNTQDLKVFADLTGQRQIERESKSWQESGKSFSEQSQDVEVLPVADLRRLPFGWALMFNRNGRPVFMQMTKWGQRKDAKQIKAALGRYNSELLDELTSGNNQVSETALTASPTAQPAQPAQPAQSAQPAAVGQTTGVAAGEPPASEQTPEPATASAGSAGSMDALVRSYSTASTASASAGTESTAGADDTESAASSSNADDTVAEGPEAGQHDGRRAGGPAGGDESAGAGPVGLPPVR